MAWRAEDKNNENSRGMVTLPNVPDVTETVVRILKHNEMATTVRPCRNLTKKY